MTDLTRNSPRVFQGEAPPGSILAFLMAAVALYEGAALMLNASGYAANCTPTASGKFLGFCVEPVDNSAGSAGGATCQVQTEGLAWLNVANGSNWALTDVGSTVYASDGDTFTTSAGTNNIVVGKVVQVPAAAVGAASGLVLVKFEATAIRSI